MKKSKVAFIISIILLVVSLMYIATYLILDKLLIEQLSIIYFFIYEFMAMPVFFLSLSFIITKPIAKDILKYRPKCPTKLLGFIGAGLILAYIVFLASGLIFEHIKFIDIASVQTSIALHPPTQTYVISKEFAPIVFFVNNSGLFIIPGALLAIGIFAKKQI